MNKFILIIGFFTIFIGCENDLNWNLPRSNPNDLFNVCYENNCDSLGEIAFGNWELITLTFDTRKGKAFRSSREPGDFIEISCPASTNSKLSFWIKDWDWGEDETVLTNGQLVKVYINNVQSSLHVVRKPSFLSNSHWWKVSTDVYQASPAIIRIEILGVTDEYDRLRSRKAVIDEIEIKCH